MSNSSECSLIAVFGESGRESVVGLGSPYFQHQEAGLVNVTTQLEGTTYLHCRVNRLSGKTVSKSCAIVTITKINSGREEKKFVCSIKTMTVYWVVHGISFF